jgi:hypothetical protein
VHFAQITPYNFDREHSLRTHLGFNEREEIVELTNFFKFLTALEQTDFIKNFILY